MQTLLFQGEDDLPARQLLVAPGKIGPLYLRLMDMFLILVVCTAASGALLHFRPIWDDNNPLGRFLRTFGAGNVFCLGIVHIAPYTYVYFNTLMERVGFYLNFEFGGIAVTFGFNVMLVLMALSKGLGNEDDHDMGSEGLKTKDKNEGGSEETASDDVRRSSVLKFIMDQMAMVFFEFGISVHSVLVGIRLGVKRVGETESARTYVIALIFHQLLEAVALGIYVSSKRIGFAQGWFLTILAQLMFPLGVAIGIGVADTFDPNSISVLSSRAILNGVAAGILVYISTMIITAQEVRMESLMLLPKRWHRAMVYAGFICGTITMSLISIWA